jgi:hypothetical protein
MTSTTSSGHNSAFYIVIYYIKGAIMPGRSSIC